ncbi:hypothetical protein BGW80DRAFT_1360837 [Lactifluus volemus]|nr:hypothetical protein BGW80DRAFT_1360837 [Lactifluus volemus]
MRGRAVIYVHCYCPTAPPPSSRYYFSSTPLPPVRFGSYSFPATMMPSSILRLACFSNQVHSKRCAHRHASGFIVNSARYHCGLLGCPRASRV